MFEHDGRRFTLVAVVAAARNGVIGRDGGMPWTLKADLKRYRALTLGRPMIMGRKTLASIGCLLDGRDTIVLTRSGETPIEGAHVARDADAALRMPAERAAERGTDEIAIVGGAEIYRLFLDRTDRIEMTRIEAEPEGDTVFPALDAEEWVSQDKGTMERGPADTADARFITLSRSNGGGPAQA